MSTPSEDLRRAAAILRDRAAMTTEGPWLSTKMLDHTYGLWAVGAAFDGSHDQFGSTNVEPDARWIALLSPVVAEPLAAWLDEDAALGTTLIDSDPSVQFARLIVQTALGDTTP